MHIIVPLSQHPNASESDLVVVWQDPETHDAVWAAASGFIATIGNTDAAFADLFATKDAAVLCQEGAKAPCCTRDEGGPFGAAL